MEEEQKPQRRISNGTAVAMVLVALVLDVISLIPVAGSLISAVFGMGIFGLWFYFLGVPLISPKKIASWGLNAIAEAFPAIGSVWIGVTVGVILMIAITRTEDATGLQIANKVPIGKNLSIKDARRAANPGKALEARQRLQRRLERQTQNSAPASPEIKERQQMRDINYKKAA